MCLKLLLLLASLSYIQCRSATGQEYVIIVGGKVTPNADYLITGIFNSTKGQTNVLFTIEGKSGPDETPVSTSTSALFQGQETKVITLKTGPWREGKYWLNVNGTGGHNFNETVNLYLDSEHVLLFTQTDKKTYKPGQLVKFRTVVTNQDLIPLKEKSIRTEIKDSEGNLIKIFQDVTTSSGVVGHELKLSDETVLGRWTIKSTVGSSKTEKEIIIEEYILPAFDVQIQVPPFLTVNSTSFPVTVRADYTYGRPVKGRLSLSVLENSYRWYGGNQKLVEYHTDIDGEMTLTVDPVDFVRQKHIHYVQQYDISASVIDPLTNKTYNSTKQISVHRRPYKFSFYKSPRDFTPGEPVKVSVKVSNPDDTQIEDSDTSIAVYYTVGDSERQASGKLQRGIATVLIDTTPELKEKVKVSKVDGAEKIVYPYPKRELTGIQVDAEYKGMRDTVGYLYKANKDYCKVKVEATDEKQVYEVGDEMTIKVQSTDQVNRVNYYVVSRKGLIESQTVEANEENEVTLNLTITPDMTPFSRVLVHTFCNRTQRINKLDVDVVIPGKTKVKVGFNVTQTEPGSNVGVVINSSPNSWVGLMGVDKRVFLLRQGNDIQSSDLSESTKKYVGCNGDSDFYSCSRGSHSRYYYDSDGIADSLRSAGLHVITNTTYEYDFSYPRLYNSPVLRGVPAPPGLSPVALSAVEADSGYRMKSHHQKFSKVEKQIKLRKEFPETWIWSGIEVGESGEATISEQVPDSITSWILSAFATNEETGLAVSPNKATLKVFRPFFVKLNLPYSIVRGETVAIEAIVYNYQDTDVSAEVTINNEEREFQFVVAEEDSNDVANDETEQTKIVQVPANDGARVSFLITPKKVGYITVDVKALVGSTGDRVSQKLLVKPEGETQYFNKAFLLNLTPKKRVTRETVAISIPPNAVPDSEKIQVSVIGDILGPAMNNIDKLLKMPYGCGEQNMINFVPNILVLKYLTSRDELTTAVKSKALSHIESGYQREMTYRHEDGSFSAFGKSDRKGSTWLTAFVLKSFLQAASFVDLDERVINASINFLLSKQRADGSFAEEGRLISPSMQSGTKGKTIALSAYVYSALLTDDKVKSQYENETDKVEQYLVTSLVSSTDIYDVAIINYALHLADSPNKDAAFEKLMSMGTRRQGQLFWEKEGENKQEEASVEMTSYALMTLMLRNDSQEALSVVKWLVSKQNAQGGFRSTQVTVIGLEALTAFASKVTNLAPSLEVIVEGDHSTGQVLKVDESNSQVLQKLQLNGKARKVELVISGAGSVVAQVSWQYNTVKTSRASPFAITCQPLSENELKLCAKYSGEKESGMTVMEVNLPSGYVVDLERLEEQKKAAKRVETRESETVAVFYFDQVTQNETCANVGMERRTKVANAKPSVAKIYSYYETAQEMSTLCELQKASTCDICEGEDCGKSCNK